MGGGRWDSDAYTKGFSSRRASGTKDFDYDDKVRTGRASGIHPDLDPKKVAGPSSPFAGQPVRESRDSDEHPNSLPIAVFFDVTGSMGHIPQVLQTKLAALMDTILAKAKITDPQILVGAIGDSYCDSYPFQVGQFESDNRFDEQLRNIILEGGGGGQIKESYALAYRFVADHTATDSFEKRGKKGYLFTMGDEMPHPFLDAEHVEQTFGVKARENESVESLLSRALEKWEVFHIHVMEGAYSSGHAFDEIHSRWRALLGERVVKIEDSTLVCEVIAGLIHMLESSYDADKVVADLGLKGKAADTVKNALVPVSMNVPAHVAAGGLPAGHAGAKGGMRTV